MGTPIFPEVAAESVRAEFQTALPDAGRVTEIALLAKSFGHQSFMLTTESGARYVVKIARIPAEVARLHRTADFTKRALAGGVATPEILHVGPACEAFGSRPYLIQQFWPGLDAEEAWPGLSQEARRRFLDDFGAATARLHSIGAAQFDEGIVPSGERSHWPAHVRSRLERCRRDNEKAGVLSSREIDGTAGRILELVQTLGDVVTPVLVHRDLYLRNTLASDGAFRGLLDFEHARFSDPLMEFVALRILLFEEHPASESSFQAGYRRIQPAPYPQQEERLALCMGLELLGRIPYLQRNGQREAVAAAVAKVAQWRL